MNPGVNVMSQTSFIRNAANKAICQIAQVLVKNDTGTIVSVNCSDGDCILINSGASERFNNNKVFSVLCNKQLYFAESANTVNYNATMTMSGDGASVTLTW